VRVALGLLCSFLPCLGVRDRFWGDKDLVDVPWVSVTNRAGLEEGLKCDTCILGLQVDNGTEWLHLGGDLNTFLPIVSEPVQTAATSDLSLLAALMMVREGAGPQSSIGLHISFLTPSILPSSLSVISSVFPEPDLPLPLFVSAEVLTSSSSSSQTTHPELLETLSVLVPGATPVLGWSTRHGLDPLWERINREAVLKEFQVSRIVRVVEHLYRSPQSIPKDDEPFKLGETKIKKQKKH